MVDYVLRDKLDTLNSTLKEILELLRDKEKTVVINSPITVSREELIELSHSIKPKVVSNEEFIERLQKVDFNRLEKELKTNESISKLNRVIDLLELVAEQNNQILVNTSTSKRVLAAEDIIYFDVSKALYKREVGSGEYIKVAFITGDGKITFLARNESIVETPNYYSSLWYYLNEVGELRYSTFDMVNINQIYVDKSLEDGRYYVTGYIDNKGKAIYYDQYI